VVLFLLLCAIESYVSVLGGRKPLLVENGERWREDEPLSN
jgi:hypothetical protein